jgi:hypothetical protein
LSGDGLLHGVLMLRRIEVNVATVLNAVEAW